MDVRFKSQADLVSVEVLAQRWIPYAYHERTDEVSWCLPQGTAVQPFYDEYVSHCRQYVVNALISPRTSIKALLRFANQLPELQNPSGFIFDLSRCGSTLISGCLAQLEQGSVLSESMLFQPDGAEKRRSFPQAYVLQIQHTLSGLHHALIQNSYEPPEKHS